MEEFRASALLMDCRRREGFAVEDGVGGLKTAFRAVCAISSGVRA